MLVGTCENKVVVPRIGLEALVNEGRIGDALYFAYGSNRSTPRLRYRVPGRRFIFVAQLPIYKLCSASAAKTVLRNAMLSGPRSQRML